MTNAQTASFGKHARICGWVGIAALAAGLWTTRAGTLKARHPLPQGVTSPVLALELIRNPQLVDQIARPDPPAQAGMPAPRPRHEREQLTHAIAIDTWVFIPAYTIFLVLVGSLVVKHGPQRVRLLGLIVIGATLAGAVFDLLENREMRALLSGPGDPRSPSVIKWALLSVAIMASTPVFLLGPPRLLLRSIGYAGIASALWAGADGLLGVLWRNDQMIEAAAGRMSLAFILVVLFLIGLEPLKDGIMPALDALARKWPFSWLVAWPTADKDETVGDSVL
jgi:hypothetical protein